MRSVWAGWWSGRCLALAIVRAAVGWLVGWLAGGGVRPILGVGLRRTNSSGAARRGDMGGKGHALKAGSGSNDALLLQPGRINAWWSVLCIHDVLHGICR